MPHRYGHDTQRFFESFDIGGFAFAEPLLQHPGTVDAGNTHGQRESVLVVDHGTLHCPPNVDGLFPHRAVGLLDFDRFATSFERSYLAVVEVLTVLNGELEQIDRVDRVHGAAPSGVSIEADHRHWKTNLRCSVQVIVRTDQMHFHVTVKSVAPG